MPGMGSWTVCSRPRPLFLDQELISYRYSSCYCCQTCWGNLFTKDQGSVVSTWIRMKFSRNVLQVNTHQLTESEFRFYAIISKWRPSRHFLWESTATWWVKMKCLLRAYAASSTSSWSIVHLYLFILKLTSRSRTCLEDWSVQYTNSSHFKPIPVHHSVLWSNEQISSSGIAAWFSPAERGLVFLGHLAWLVHCPAQNRWLVIKVHKVNQSCSGQPPF